MLYQDNQVPPTRYNGIRTASAILGTTIPIIIGQQRTGWKLLWYGDFISKKAKQQGGGSGLGKGGTQYVYSASVIGSVCMGPTSNFLGLWDSVSKFAIQTYSESFSVGGGANPTYTPTNAATYRQDLGAGFNSSYSYSVNDYGSPGTITLSGTTQVPLTYTSNVTPGPGEYTVTSSPNIGPFQVNSVANASGGNTVYSGSFAGGGSNAFAGFVFAIHGFINSQNNGQFTCTASTTSTITLNNSNGVAETRLSEAIVISSTPTYVFNGAQTGQTVTVIYASFSYQQVETELQVAAATVTVQYQTSFASNVSVTYYPSGVGLTAVSGTPSAGQYNPNGGNYQFNAADFGKGVSITYKFNNPNQDANAPSSINLTFFTGGLGQAPWSYMSSKHSAEALGYSEIAYAASSGLYLGFSPVLPQYNFEILGSYPFGNGVPDANIADAIYGLLTSLSYKINFQPNFIDASLMQGPTSVKSMWTANNFFISALLDSQSPLMSVIGTWCEAGQAYVSWDEGRLKFTPLSDTSAVGHGVIYNPPTEPIVDLDDNDFVVETNKDPIQFEQTPWQTRWNRVSIRWSVRSNSYNEDILQVQDEASIQQYGLLAEQPKDYQFLCTLTAAQFAANMRLQRLSAIYATYKFTLKSNFAFLSPGDVITVTDGQLGTPGTLFGRIPVRITKMTDDPKKGIEIEAETFPWSVGTALLYNRQAVLPSNVLDAAQANPGDTIPIIFEVPNKAAQWAGDKIYIFANGANSNWGGFELYVSFNGVDYNYYGLYDTPARIGTTTADFPIPAGFTAGGPLPFLDTSDTLSVDMSVEDSVLQSVTAADRDAFVTLSGLLTAGAVTNTTSTAIQGTVIGTSTSIAAPGSQGPNLSTNVTQGKVWSPLAVMPWTNLNNILTTGGSYATAALNYNGVVGSSNTGWSQFALLDLFNFNLMGAGPIIGITVTAKTFISSPSSGTTGEVKAFLIKSGSVVGNSTAQINLTTTPTVYTVGSASNMSAWGLGNSTTITASDINSGAFGVGFVAIIQTTGSLPATATVNLNDITMTVYWSAGGAAVGWTNPQYVNNSSPGNFAVATLTSSAFTQILLATGFNFNMPFGFVLDGIEVTVEYQVAGGNANLTAILYWNGLQIGTPHGVTNAIGPVDYTLGGQNDMWGIDQYADVDTLNSSTFGVGFYVEGIVGETISIRNVRMTLYGSSVTNLELISYQTATLTGQNSYDITSIQRGVMGSYPCDHPSGAVFARLDQATLIYSVPANYVGNTIFFKFCSFNSYGNQLQSLSQVVPYELNVRGLAPGAIDPSTGHLLTGTPNWPVPHMEAATAAVHGTYGVQNIPSGYALVGPLNKSSGTPEWTPVITGGGGNGAVSNLFVISISSNFTASAWDDCICDTSGGNLYVTLPSALDNPNTAIAVQKNTADLNIVTVLPTGSDTIQGQSSVVLSQFGNSIYFVSDGASNWIILSGWSQQATGTYVGEIAIPPTTRGDFQIVHGLGITPSNAQIQLTTNGLIRFQTTRYDNTYLYLNASADNLQGYVSLWV